MQKKQSRLFVKSFWEIATLVTVLVLGFLFRVYRISQLLGFYYDQGRDALVIWDLLHKGKLFLIGPTTGIAGIFRGPWYYWLITPFYYIGSGNPVYPSVFLAFSTTIAFFFSYKIGVKIQGKVTGLISALIGSLSFYLVLAGRWLSNPTPMFLISMGLIYSLILIFEKKEWAWILLSFILGMSMQFGSSGEIFYFPAVFIIILWKKIFPRPKIIFISILVFLLTLAPQIMFDIKHGGILRQNIYKFLFGEGSFKASFWQTLRVRLPFYLDVFGSKIFPQTPLLQKVFGLIFTAIVILKRKILFKSRYFSVTFIIFATPLIGMLFFQGNFGNVYDYYFTGYYLIFVLIFAATLGVVWDKAWGKVLVIIFLLLFIKDNLPQIRNYIVSGVDGPTTVAFGNEKMAIDWVYRDAGSRSFNVDVYVPPVIPYAYDYLFEWYGKTRFDKTPEVKTNVPLLYTLYEVDPDHPERLTAWLNRQEGIAKVIKEVKFGGITVQERERVFAKK